jgi:hypothetical protein
MLERVVISHVDVFLRTPNNTHFLHTGAILKLIQLNWRHVNTRA